MEYIRQVMEFQVCPIGIEAVRCISISGTVNYDRKNLLILAADGVSLIVLDLGLSSSWRVIWVMDSHSSMNANIVRFCVGDVKTP